mmetsp:Transcript_8335/g.12341  ORF Transcript_8335/g.12341 Transcript_8335/m.12341 type:complete len:639 (-) Transcript_8335:12-1928(-)
MIEFERRKKLSKHLEKLNFEQLSAVVSILQENSADGTHSQGIRFDLLSDDTFETVEDYVLACFKSNTAEQKTPIKNHKGIKKKQKKTRLGEDSASKTTKKTPEKTKKMLLKTLGNHLIAELSSQKNAWPFLEPIDADALELYDYHMVIKEPMDLKTLGEELRQDKITTFEKFVERANLIFKNCYLYNRPDSEIVKMAKDLETSFLEKVIDLEKIVEMKSRTPAKSPKKQLYSPKVVKSSKKRRGSPKTKRTPKKETPKKILKSPKKDTLYTKMLHENRTPTQQKKKRDDVLEESQRHSSRLDSLLTKYQNILITNDDEDEEEEEKTPDIKLQTPVWKKRARKLSDELKQHFSNSDSKQDMDQEDDSDFDSISMELEQMPPPKSHAPKPTPRNPEQSYKRHGAILPQQRTEQLSEYSHTSTDIHTRQFSIGSLSDNPALSTIGQYGSDEDDAEDDDDDDFDIQSNQYDQENDDAISMPSSLVVEPSQSVPSVRFNPSEAAPSTVASSVASYTPSSITNSSFQQKSPPTKKTIANHVKLYFDWNQEVCRFQMDEEALKLDYVPLFNKRLRVYGYTVDDITIKYQDDEGDWVRLCESDEWHEMLRCHDPTRLLRLTCYLKDKTKRSMADLQTGKIMPFSST